MSPETINTTGNAHAAERRPPGYRVLLAAVFHGQRVRCLSPPPDDFINLFLDVDGGLMHGEEA